MYKFFCRIKFITNLNGGVKMKKVNWGALVAVTAAFTVLAAVIVHISQELKEVNEMVSAIKDETDDAA